ncbi:hypothetical protein Tco_0378224 [Tanacetum coccineum]
MLLQEFDIEIRDKKGAENLAVDHLSRLENPELGKLTKAEIRNLFPEEWLMAISDKNNEPWHYFWDDPSIRVVCGRIFEGAWPNMRHHKFFDNVTADHLEDIMASPPPQEKSSRPGFNGHISSEMHSAKYLMFRELTLWDLSPHQTETNRHIINLTAEGDLRKFSDIGAWVQVPRCMAWLDYDEHVDSLSTMDNEVGVTSPESTTQTLPSFEEYTPPMTYPEEA